MASYRLVLDLSRLSLEEQEAVVAAVARLGFAERWRVVDGPRREGEFDAEEWDRLEAGLKPWAERIELQVSSA